MTNTETARYIIRINRLYLYETEATQGGYIVSFKAGSSFDKACIYPNIEPAVKMAKQINGQVIKITETEIEGEDVELELAKEELESVKLELKKTKMILEKYRK